MVINILYFDYFRKTGNGAINLQKTTNEEVVKVNIANQVEEAKAETQRDINYDEKTAERALKEADKLVKELQGEAKVEINLKKEQESVSNKKGEIKKVT